ncbi:MAG: sigma-70 family RNA polymerase sigma factor [Acidimicrobiia bacterium]|nr:sigma-70 family RNA polymerase sigma factor [Acidimicrobiia bacterium]
MTAERTGVPGDAELVARALQGSQDACRALVERYATPAVNMAARMVRDRALAEDMAQEAFARAFDRLDTFSAGGRFSAWFFQILHRVTIDHLRRKRVPGVSLDELEAAGHPGLASPAAGPAELAERGDLRAALGQVLQRIRPEYREAVLLRYREELSVEEVAGVMGIPVGTVKTFLFRARKEMAAALAGRGWGTGPEARQAVETGARKGP